MPPTLYTESPTLKRRLRTYTANGYAFQMVLVQKGSFLFQGDHEITFPADFELGQYPVTQGLWQAVMGENPAYFKGDNRPVERVRWDDIIGTKEGGKQDDVKDGFLDRLNALSEIEALNAVDGCRFGLPSEAQWEYAACGGRYGQALGYEYAGSNYLPEVGWYPENSQMHTHSVGRKKSNLLGLYDISGNVCETCQDVWNEDYKDTPQNGSAWMEDRNKNLHVIRGGAWGMDGVFSLVANRSRYYTNDQLNFIGLRLSRYQTASGK
ncbi:MAG TPA: formylglycine-generating enzyme family protein [Phaeodactylibacter sp.]|nr:formylglycine-generating enzyme family protein [Phaeodactylibacter sp.]